VQQLYRHQKHLYSTPSVLCVSSSVATTWRMGHAVPAQDSFLLGLFAGCKVCCLELVQCLQANNVRRVHTVLSSTAFAFHIKALCVCAACRPAKGMHWV
jgi:hypothetical protein